MSFSEDDLKILAAELSFRTDMDAALETWSLEHQEEQVLEAEQTLCLWISRLVHERHHLREAAALRFDESEESVEIIGPQGGFEVSFALLEPGARERVSKAVTEGASFTLSVKREKGGSLMTDILLIVAPCPRSSPRTSLAVFYCGEKADYLVQVFLQRAANLASRDLMVIRNQDERLRGYRQMAAKMAQMCSGSVSLAQLRLNRMRRLLREGGEVNDWDCDLSSIIQDLTEAQQAMDRARLMGSQPWERFKETINMGPFVNDIGRRLNEAVAGELSPVVAPESLDKCRKSRLRLKASPVRMNYAFRDLILGAWVLGNKQRPLDISLVEGETDRLILRGASYRPTTTGVGVITKLNGPDLVHMLRDPEVFLRTTSATESAERSLGLQNAFDTFDEIQARVIAHNNENELGFEISLPSENTASQHS